MLIDFFLYILNLSTLKFIFILLVLTIIIHLIKIYLIKKKFLYIQAIKYTLNKLNLKQKLQFFTKNKIKFIRTFSVFSKILNLTFMGVFLIDGGSLLENTTEAFQKLSKKEKLTLISITVIVVICTGTSATLLSDADLTKVFTEICGTNNILIYKFLRGFL